MVASAPEARLIANVFSRSRSGETPLRVLANTTGKLLTDAYSGYDKVTVPGSRERAGCMAHLRRKFFEAIGTAPEAARKGMDLIVDLYRVESIAIGNAYMARRHTRSCAWTTANRRLSR